MLTVCRLCLAKDPSFHIFNSQVSVRILSCTGLEPEPNDGLPQLICLACRQRLEEFHYFRKRCQGADRRLRNEKIRNRNGHQDALFRDEDEDALNLRDVAQCGATACSESNSRWRKEAAKLMNLELETYKKELQQMCKQQVREEIEQQVRQEVTSTLLAEAQRDCRLKVIEEVFYDVESFFIQLRDQTAYGSEGFISEFDPTDTQTTSTLAPQTFVDVPLVPEQLNMQPVDQGVVELSDAESRAETPFVIQGNVPMAMVIPKQEAPDSPRSIVPVPMVEINIENDQLNHLREEGGHSSFIIPKATPPRKYRKHSRSLNYLSPRKHTRSSLNQHLHLCRKHSLRSQQQNANDHEDCDVCQLQKGKKLEKKSSTSTDK